ncbi:MAG: hypothetical protein JSU90_05385 [Nitrospiraceae bacterium]|nr:MAG: hypothetical protein JSU90_05385 [Nitrospiraceae bacterium]
MTYVTKLKLTFLTPGPLACLVFLAVLTIFSCPAGADNGGVIALQYPPDKVVKEFGLLNVSLSVPAGSADRITVRDNDREIITIVPDEKFECFAVPLVLGMNEIRIIAERDGSGVYDTVFHAYLRSDLEARYRTAPEGFRKDYFHDGAYPQCAECHILVPREHDKKPVSPDSFIAERFDKDTVISVTSTCYSCHRKMASYYPYVHGPVAVWSCLSCHEVSSTPKYAVKKPDTDVCFTCHVDQKNNWAGKKVTHGPVTLGNCAICHSPHAAPYPFNLYKATWDLCVNCHAEKGSGKHVLGDSFSTAGHPTRGKADPVKIGKELTCASCHDPHASNYPHLWAFDVDSIFELCRKCHYDK